MKRFVFVPFEMVMNKESLAIAEDLSKSSNISIRLGQENEFPNITDVDIICIPNIFDISFLNKVKCNFLQIINYSNDFIQMNKKFKCKITSNNKEYIFNPTIAEKHCLKFNVRICEADQYSFAIIDENNSVISDDYFFEVV